MDNDTTQFQSVVPAAPAPYRAVYIVLITLVALADAALLAVAVSDYLEVDRRNRQVFDVLAGFNIASETCRLEATGPTTYAQNNWGVAFDLPDGYVVAENQVSEGGAIEMTLVKGLDRNSYADSSVKIWVGPAAGFSRYLAKPYTTYGGYRKFVAVSRQAVGYSDPAKADEAGQVAVIDDSRNEREIRVSYSLLREDAETLANGVILSMRLLPKQNQETVYRPGWKAYIEKPLSFQYPEDYTIDKGFAGKVTVSGTGGRLDIQTNYLLDAGSVPHRPYTPALKTDAAMPDDMFDLSYGVDVRASLYYGPDAKEYDRSILRDIAGTISLRR